MYGAQVEQGRPAASARRLNHVQHVESEYRSVAELLASAHGAEEWSLLVTGDCGRRHPGVQILLESRMAAHLVALAAFFMQAEPPAIPMLEVVSDLHRDSSAHQGELTFEEVE